MSFRLTWKYSEFRYVHTVWDTIIDPAFCTFIDHGVKNSHFDDNVKNPCSRIKLENLYWTHCLLYIILYCITLLMIKYVFLFSRFAKKHCDIQLREIFVVPVSLEKTHALSSLHVVRIDSDAKTD